MQRWCGILVLAIGVVAACTPPPPDGTLLAVAYTDVDGIAGYDGAAGDVMIAQLVDTDGDGAVSSGDTVMMGQFPKDFAATEFGSFTSTTHVIDTVRRAQSDDVTVENDIGTFMWDDNVDSEKYGEFLDGNDLTEIIDSYADEDEVIQVMPSSPSAPDADVSLGREADVGDDAHIDVDIFV